MDLFIYYEDTDLSHRLREVGYEVRLVADVIVDHEHAASSGTSSPMFLRVNACNRIVVAAQHTPRGVVACAIARSTAWAVRSGGREPVTRGVLQGLLALPRVLRHRIVPRPRRQGSRPRGRDRGRWVRHGTQRGTELRNAYALADRLTR